MRHPRRLLFFAVPLLFAIACGGSEQTIKLTESPTPAPTATRAPPTKTLGPTPTRVPTTPPTPMLGTRENPAPIGAVLQIGTDWEIKVISVIPDALNEIMAENMFNDPPEAGKQFFLVTVEAKRIAAESEAFDASYSLRAVGPSSVGYSAFENSCGVIPNEFPSSELFEGGVLQGNVCWQVKADDAAALVMYYDEFLAGEDKRLFMALH